MARKQQRRNQQSAAAVAAPVDWAAEEARARQDLKRNAEAIDNTPRGTPSTKPPTWRLGRSPSSTPSDRTR